MKHILTTLLFLTANLTAFAQMDSLAQTDLAKAIEPLKTSIQSLQKENRKLRNDVRKLDRKQENAGKKMDSLQVQMGKNSEAIALTASELGIKITATETNAERKITEVDRSLGRNARYGLIGLLAALLLSAVLYWLLGRRQKTDKTDLLKRLNQAKTGIEERLVKEFGKQTDLMESQLQLLDRQKSEKPASANAEPDHSLALKVASEINLIERNVNLMDKGTRGLKQLQRSVGKLKDNLAANGYDMPALLGKPFHQGMNAIVASSVPDENLEPGSETITKILIPQVNFNGKMVQTAQIEVSVGG